MGNDLFRSLNSSTALGQAIVGDLISGIADSRQHTILAGGTPLLRLLKTGDWVFGQQNTDVQEGSVWAINPMSIAHGYVCWGQDTSGGPIGEVMGPISRAKPNRPDPIGGNQFGEQRACEMACMLGDDKGVTVLYKVNSISGLREFDNVLAALIVQLRKNPDFPVPVIQLGTSGYQNKKHGWIPTPVLEIVGWANYGGEMEGSGGDNAPPRTNPPAQQAKRPAVHQSETVARAAAQPQAASAQQAAGAAEKTVQAEAPTRAASGPIPRRRPVERAAGA